MNWDAVQSFCSLILAGTIAVSVFALHRIMRELRGISALMVTRLGSRDADASLTKKSIVSDSPAATARSQASTRENVPA